MLIPSRLKTRWWLLGVCLCLFGILLARLLSPQLGQPAAKYMKSMGHLAAISGMFVIAYGVSRRLREAKPDDDSSAS